MSHYTQDRGGYPYQGGYDQSGYGGDGMDGVMSNPFGASLATPFPNQPPPVYANNNNKMPPPPPTAAEQMQYQNNSGYNDDHNGMNGTSDYHQPRHPGGYNFTTSAIGEYSQAPQVGPPQADPAIEMHLRDCAESNAPSHFVRMSTSKWGITPGAKTKAGVTIGVVFQPLARPAPGFNDVPLVNFGPNGTVVRCNRCRTYINPFVRWESNGRRWICNLCSRSNEIVNSYYNALDDTGKRIDRYERPELSQGSVEYVAPGEYMIRAPQPAVFVFLIDVSYPSIQSGMIGVVAAAIKSVVQNHGQESGLCGGSRTQIAIMTYDSSIHFYNLSPNLAQPQMVVVSDLDDIFLPLPDNMLVNVSESLPTILSLLDALPSLFKDSKIGDSCLGSAVQAAHYAMKHIGGKLLLFSSGIPTVGLNVLKASRENYKLIGTDREIELLKPESDAYAKMATELTKVQISVELFVAAQNYTDLASLAPLAKNTGGDIRYYPDPYFGEQMRNEIVHVLTRQMGWEAVMRVRVSRGWKITGFYGHLFVRGSDLLVVPNCHEDQTFSVTIEHNEDEKPDPVWGVQCALLYTHSDNERRIRVHTVSGVCTQSFQDSLDSVDAAAAATIIANEAIATALRMKVSDGRHFIHSICQQICSASSSCQTEACADIPLYLMGLLKSIAFRAANDISADLRVYHWARLESLAIKQQVAYFWPRLFSLHNLLPAEYDANGNVMLPKPIQCLSSEVMTQDGAYLVEDGETMMLWLGKSVNSNFLYALFGVVSLEEVDVNTADKVIGSTGDPLAMRVLEILNQIRAERQPPWMKLLVIRQGDPKEQRYFAALVEDRAMGLNMTLNEFCTRMGYARGPRNETPQGPPMMPDGGQYNQGPPMGNQNNNYPAQYTGYTYGR